MRRLLLAAVLCAIGASEVEAGTGDAAASDLIRRADAAVRAGRKEEARSLLEKSEGRPLDEAQLNQVAALDEQLSDYCGSSRVAARLTVVVPANPGAWILYADAAAFCGQRKEALRALAAAQAFDMGRELEEQVPYLYLYLGEYRPALESSSRYLKHHPEDVWHWFRRTEAAIGAGDRAAAFDALGRAEALISSEPPNPGLEDVYARLGEASEAKRIMWILVSCRANIAADSTEDWVREARQVERRLSLKALAQAQRRRATDAESQKNLALIFSEIARQATSRGGPDGLRKLLNRAQKAVSSGERPEGFLFQAQGYALAEEDPDAAGLFSALFDAPEDRQAVATLRSWEKEEGDREKLTRLLSTLNGPDTPARDGSRREALDFLVQTSTQNGRDTGLSILIASLYAELGDRKSLEMLQDLLKTQPHNADVLIALARTAGRFGMGNLVLRSLEEAEHAAGDRERLHAVALLYQDAGAFDRALVILRRLALSSPADARLLHDEGVAEFLRGDADGGAREFLAALRLDPKFLDGYLGLGAAYEKQGKPCEALAAYEKALALKGLSEEAKGSLLKRRAELAAKVKHD